MDDLRPSAFSMALIGLVLNRVDVLLLSAFVPAAAVGPYYAAVQIAAIGAFGLNAINVVLAPMISECHAKGDLKELTQLTRRAAMLSLVATGAVTLGAVVLGEPVLEMFGPKFSQAYVPLLIILTGQVINAGCGPVGYLLTMTRYTHIAPRLFGTAALMNIGLSLLLIPRFGMYGAAAATATALVAWNLAALAFVLRYLKINPTIFGLASS
jgi:O-antigen/teichoic acid export membrane protein